MWTEQEFKLWAEKKHHRYFARNGTAYDDIDWEFRIPGLFICISLYQKQEGGEEWCFHTVPHQGQSRGCELQHWEPFQTELIPLCLLIDPTLERTLLSKKIDPYQTHQPPAL